MPEPALGLRSSLSNETSFLKRIRENLESVWSVRRGRFVPGEVAAGAPIHLLQEPCEKRSFGAQAGSTGIHVLIFVALVIVMANGPVNTDRPVPLGSTLKAFHFFPTSSAPSSAQESLGKAGGSGNHNPLPPTAGNLVPYSSIVLSPPRASDLQNHALPVPAAVFDADAPDFASPTKDPGLPWMKDRNGSGGPGENGLGVGKDRGMGDVDGNGVGIVNEAGPYATVASPVVCLRCPDPAYSDEARKVKVQGAVTLRVLVGADGRVKSLQVTRGIGMGLDENAVSAVRTWQFIPAKDAARRPIATWITVETTFRLY
jgi:TonB family protein